MAAIRYELDPKFSLVAKVGFILPQGEFKETINATNVTTGDSIEGGLLIADMDDITPKIYIAGQYNVTKNIGLSLFLSHILGKKVDSEEEFEDMREGGKADSYSDLTSLHDESATFDTPAVTAYGLSLTWYFW